MRGREGGEGVTYVKGGREETPSREVCGEEMDLGESGRGES